MLFAIIFILIGLIVWGLIYLTTLDGSYAVRRTKLINTDIGTAFDKIRDFETWADWSPWIMHEPHTKLVFSDNCSEEGGYYTWDGKLVGAGKLIHVKFEQRYFFSPEKVSLFKYSNSHRIYVFQLRNLGLRR